MNRAHRERMACLAYLRGYSVMNFTEEFYLASSDGRNGCPGRQHPCSEAPLWLWETKDLLRSQLKNEITLDFDRPTIEENLEGATSVYKMLASEWGIMIWPFFSGNRGIHLTLFLDTRAAYPTLTGKLLRARIRLPDLKMWLVERIVGRGTIRELCVDANRVGSPKDEKSRPPLWRACGSIHPKGGRHKTFLPSGVPADPRDLPKEVHYPPLLIQEWKIPVELLEEYLDQRISELKEMEAQRRTWRPGRSSKVGREPCAEMLLTTPIGDRRHRAAFFLAAVLKRRGLAKDQALGELSSWNSSTLGGYLSTSFLQSQTNYIYRDKARGGPGCRWCRVEILEPFGLLSLCSSCPRNSKEVRV